MTHHPHIDWVALMPDVARLLLGPINEELSDGDNLRFRNRGSMIIDLKKGVWHDWETNEGGGVVDLIKREAGEEPMAWLGSEGLLNGDARRSTNNTTKQTIKPKKPKLGRILAAYNYVDENNALVFHVVRFDPKDFRQRRPDGNGGWIWNLDGARRVPYHLPELKKAQTVFVCEGEKDANNVCKLGLTATTCPGGASKGKSKWRSEFNQYFVGKTVYISPHNDEAGRAHAMTVAGNLHSVAKEVRIFELPGLSAKDDISDWINNGGSREALLKLVEATP